MLQRAAQFVFVTMAAATASGGSAMLIADASSLLQCLQHSLSADPIVRKGAESALLSLAGAPNGLPQLLQCALASDGVVPVDLRLAASIHLKNAIAKHWNDKKETSRNSNSIMIISGDDKSIIRENILEATIISPREVKAQLVEATRYLMAADYPDRWPSLIPSIGQNLASKDNVRMHGAMAALRNLAREYEFKDEQGRTPLQEIVRQTFPTLLQMLQSVVQSKTTSLEAAQILKLICKTFWSSTYLAVPDALRDFNFFGQWMEGFFCILQLPVPSDGRGLEPYERQQQPWWKCKKWVLHIFNRFFDRYGDPKVLAGNDKLFATNFKNNFPVKFMDAYFNLLSIIGNNGYLPDRVINLSMTFLANALAKKNTYKKIREVIQPLLSQVVFPLLCFNDTDAELWTDDPHEYIRKGYDIIEDMYSPRTAAVNFMLEMARCRGKDNNNLDNFLAFIVGELTSFQQASDSQKMYRRKDGALLAVGSLSEKLKATEPYVTQLEPMILHHVMPEFQSPYGHLRAKAAWVCGQFADIEFVSSNLFQQLFERVLMGIKDQDLPVRVDSVVALRNFVEASSDLDQLRAILPQLLSEFFGLINEVDNEDLVFTLETIVDKFGEEIAPYAKSLCENLGAAFWKCIKSEDDDDDDETGALAAVGCLRAICTILESISSIPQMFPELEPTLYPIMQKMLSTEGQDVFEEVLEIMSYITFFGPAISPTMWTLYPQMCRELDDWAVDYFENILVPMDNFISHGSEVFITSRDPDYLAITFHVVSKILSNDENSEDNMKSGPLIFSCIMQNCRGRVDNYIEKFLAISWQRLTKDDDDPGNTLSRRLQDLLILVFMDALYYNPAYTLQILQQHNLVSPVFTRVFSMISATNKSGEFKHFKRENDKKVLCLGLTSVLAQQSAVLPTDILQGLVTVFISVITTLSRLRKQIKEREDEEDKDSDDEEEEYDEDDEDEELGLEEEEKDDAEALDLLAKGAKHYRFEQGQTNDSDDDYEDFFDDDDDGEFSSPIDKIDPFVFLADAMETIRVIDETRYQTLPAHLELNYQAELNELIRHSVTRRQEIMKEGNEVKHSNHHFNLSSSSCKEK